MTENRDFDSDMVAEFPIWNRHVAVCVKIAFVNEVRGRVDRD
jgi:hypothetical protein